MDLINIWSQSQDENEIKFIGASDRITDLDSSEYLSQALEQK